MLRLSGIRALSGRFYSQQRFDPTAALTVDGLRLATNRTFDLARGTDTTASLNAFGQLVFGAGSLSPTDPWTFELPLDDNPCTVSVTSTDVKQHDLSDLDDVFLALEYRSRTSGMLRPRTQACDDPGMNDWLALTKALEQTLVDHAPGWTDRNDADPGITLLEIMAYLAEGLRLHRGVVDNGPSVASRIVHALDAYDDPEPIVVRVNGERWQRVRTLADSEPGARVFTLDDATGVIAFGDGVHGRVPERGSTISARYRNKVGEEGNTSVTVRSTWPLPRRACTIALREEGTIQLEACDYP